MKTYMSSVVVGQEHLDTRRNRNHAGMVGQEKILDEFLADFMAQLDLGLDVLEKRDQCRFGVTHKETDYRSELLLGEHVRIDGMVWVSKNRHSLKFLIKFLNKGKIESTVIQVTMCLIHAGGSTKKMVAIPNLIIATIGEDSPPDWLIQPTSTS